MPELTRRRYPDRPDCWHVYYGDVHVGTIAIRIGIPHDEDPWAGPAASIPGSHLGECTSGTAKTFDKARREFQRAWRGGVANRPEGGFTALRRTPRCAAPKHTS